MNEGAAHFHRTNSQHGIDRIGRLGLQIFRAGLQGQRHNGYCQHHDGKELPAKRGGIS